MKSEQGVTLTSLVIYIAVATVLISTMAVMSSHFFANIQLVKNQSDYDFSLGFYPAQEVPSAAMMSNQPPNLFYCSTSLAKIAVEGNEKI